MVVDVVAGITGCAVVAVETVEPGADALGTFFNWS
jgi:hypothetical protein